MPGTFWAWGERLSGHSKMQLLVANRGFATFVGTVAQATDDAAPMLDEECVGPLGICAGGGYAINASFTEHCLKAVGTVVANHIGQAFRKMLPDVR